MTKVLYVSTSTTVGGAEKTLYTLATLVDPKKYEVVGVVSLKPKGAYADKLAASGHKLYTLELDGWPGLDDFKRLAEFIDASGAELVHAVMYQAIQMCRAVKSLGYCDFKLVSAPRVHYRTRGVLSLWIDGLLRGKDDLLVTESEASRDYLCNRLGYRRTKTTTIYNGVDIAGWTASPAERARIRKKALVGESDVLLGTVGRLDEQKGHAYLLEAVAKLRAVHPEVKCLIVGDGPLRKRLEAVARSLYIDAVVHFAGEVSDVPACLGAMDAFVLPSLWEGLPNALLEAMAMGLPVAAAKVDGVPEVVAHDISGLLCAPKDSQALFVVLQDLVADAALRKRLGAAAKVVVSERFKLADMISGYEAVYRQVLEPSS